MSLRVSVAMPVHNGAQFIAAAIESLRLQTLADFELLVVDDGSTDDSMQIVERYCRLDARIHLLRQAHAGVSAARNTALQAASSEYLAMLDADDRAYPPRLERQAAALDADPELLVVGSAYRLIDAEDRPGPVHVLPLGDTAIRWHALFHSPFAQPAVMLRLAPLRRLGLGYDPAIHSGVEDYDLWSRLLEHGRGANLPEPLVDYRQHAAQTSEVKAARLWAGASQVSQRNLQRLGVRLPLETVDTLRRWFYDFPAQIDPADRAAALALCEVLDQFVRLPGLERGELRRIRGRWALKLLRGMRSLPFSTRREILRRVRPGGLWAALRYGSERIKKP